jgi:hypothetical protein
MVYKLVGVKVWQQIDYLVQMPEDASMSKDKISEFMLDPINRVGKMGDGDVHPTPVKIWDPTVEEIQAASGVGKASP